VTELRICSMNVVILIKSQGRQLIELVTAAVNVITSRTFSYLVNFEREGEARRKNLQFRLYVFTSHMQSEIIPR
jgi:hypothetical protein